MSLSLHVVLKRTLFHYSASRRNAYTVPSPQRKLTTCYSLVPKKSLSSTNQEGNACCPNILERNKLQEYLSSVASSNEVTAEDIENHRPPKHAPPGTRQYESDYEKLMETLLRSFTVKQFKDGHRLFGMDLPRKRTKRELAISIIERRWQWPSLSESLKQRRDQTEVAGQVFTLSTREAFLLLGKDGSNLRSLSSKYNVQTAFVSNPLSLTVNGTRGSVAKVARYVSTFRQDIAEDTLQLPVGQDVSPKLCQRVSRLSGALVEYQDKGMFQISYHTKEPRTRHIAKALGMRAAYEPLNQSPLLACVTKKNPPSSSTTVFKSYNAFSLYPFPSPRSLPWTASTDCLLRARGVCGWFDHNPMKKPTLLDRNSLMIGIDGQEEDIRNRLLSVFTGVGTSTATVRASFGYLLFRPSSIPSNVLTPSIGESSITELLKRTSDKKRVFTPSLPKRLLDSKPAGQRLVHRLVYHAVGAPNSCNADPPTPSDFMEFEFGHEISAFSQGLSGEGSLHKGRDALPEDQDLPHISEDGCRRGSRLNLDLILPERAMDLRFSVLNVTDVPALKWPEELRIYKESVKELSVSSLDASRQILPLIFSFENVTFVLRSSILVRQSNDLPLIPDGSSTFPQVVSESILDMNSNQRYTTCEMICEEPSSDHAWRSLMLACDWLTAHEKSDILLNSCYLSDSLI